MAFWKNRFWRSTLQSRIVILALLPALIALMSSISLTVALSIVTVSTMEADLMRQRLEIARLSALSIERYRARLHELFAAGARGDLEELQTAQSVLSSLRSEIGAVAKPFAQDVRLLQLADLPDRVLSAADALIRRDAPAARQKMNNVDRAIGTLAEHFQSIAGSAEASERVARRAAESVLSDLTIASFFLGFVALAISLLVGIGTERLVRKPLTLVLTAIDRIRRGEEAPRLSTDSSSDAMSETFEAINALAEHDKERQSALAELTIAESRAKSTHQKIELSMKAAGLGSFAIVANGRKVILDKRSQGLLRIQSDEASWRGILRAIEPADRKKILDVFRRTMTNDEPIACIIRTYSRGRLPQHLQFLGQRSMDTSSFIVNGVIMDVSPQVIADEAARLSTRYETTAKLATILSHELNNMMGVIYGVAETMSDPATTKQNLERSTAVLNSVAKRGVGLVGRMTEVSRPKQVQFGIVCLNQLVKENESLLRAAAGRGIELSIKIEVENASVVGDAGLLTDILINLVINARQAMSDEGSLSIELNRVSQLPGSNNDTLLFGTSEYFLGFVDDGPGFVTSTITRSTEPFFTTKDSGSGLGLYIADQYCEAVGGSLSLENLPWRGARVIMFFPAAERRVV
ncbi:MAG: hypothetical protein IPK59_06265 [Rhodospirillaceae bacterium]|nr:hypothetical protein [Rhodospirillaceae bacterium]